MKFLLEYSVYNDRASIRDSYIQTIKDVFQDFVDDNNISKLPGDELRYNLVPDARVHPGGIYYLIDEYSEYRSNKFSTRIFSKLGSGIDIYFCIVKSKYDDFNKKVENEFINILKQLSNLKDQIENINIGFTRGVRYPKVVFFDQGILGVKEINMDNLNSTNNILDNMMNRHSLFCMSVAFSSNK